MVRQVISGLIDRLLKLSRLRNWSCSLRTLSENVRHAKTTEIALGKNPSFTTTN
jgi:hypothetical protein